MEYVLDDQLVNGITPLLTEPGRAQGNPYQLAANAAKSFMGSTVLGTGFILEPEEARALIDRDPRNKDVVLPYLGGEDLNSRYDLSPSRWIINFHDLPLERASMYEECLQIVKERVKPERDRITYSRTARERWWQYHRPAPDL